VRERVIAARERQRARFSGSSVVANAGMDGRLTQLHVRLPREASRRLLAGHRRTPLTARGHDRVLRLARTIADLAGRERILTADVEEALGYRLNVPELMAA
jgi:magnesium chelatase family protein